MPKDIEIKEALKKVASAIRNDKVKLDIKQDFDTLSKKASVVRGQMLYTIIKSLEV